MFKLLHSWVEKITSKMFTRISRNPRLYRGTTYYKVFRTLSLAEFALRKLVFPR